MTGAVIGFGNPLRGDDGIVLSLFECLQQRQLPEDVEMIDLGAPGFRLLHVLEDVERAVIVDAVRFGGDPGDAVVFTTDEARSLQSVRTTHGADVFELLELSERLEEQPDSVLVFGIEPADTSVGTDVSPRIKERIPDLADELHEVVQELSETSDERR